MCTQPPPISLLDPPLIWYCRLQKDCYLRFAELPRTTVTFACGAILFHELIDISVYKMAVEG
jgi:hypothetical protein